MARLRPALLVIGCALVVAVGAGCASPSRATTPAPAPAPAPASTQAPAPAAAAPSGAGFDLQRLVLDPAAIPVPGFLPPRTQPLAEDAVSGVVAFYDSDIDQRQLGVTIVQLPDPAAARSAMEGAAASTAEMRTGAKATPAAVGDHGVLYTGSELAGVGSTLLLFSQGRASVAMEFRSPQTDPIPDDAVLQAGLRQAELVKTTLG